jgi:hypothetical protein
MENIDVISLKRKVRELEKQHNNLTALVKVMYANLRRYRSEMERVSSSGGGMPSHHQTHPHLSTGHSQSLNISHHDLKADEILSQLAANVR